MEIGEVSFGYLKALEQKTKDKRQKRKKTNNKRHKTKHKNQKVGILSKLGN